MSEFAPCPTCSQAQAQPVKWTFWGGALGPRLFTHVKCAACGAVYNGKTGKSNTTAIIIYNMAFLVIGFAVAYALFSL